MSISTRYVFVASMDVTPEAEALFNEVYDTEHVPNLLQVPGVRSVTGQPSSRPIPDGSVDGTGTSKSPQPARCDHEGPTPPPSLSGIGTAVWMAAAIYSRVRATLASGSLAIAGTRRRNRARTG